MSTYTRKNEDPSPNPAVVLDVPEEDSFESPIKIVEGEAALKYAADLAFMSEPVEVLILESHDPNDSVRLIPIGVNGKTYYLLRGQWTTVPRFVLEVIVKAKREAWRFGYRKGPDGSTFETQQMHHILRYPHHYRDQNPLGAAWYDSIKDKHN